MMRSRLAARSARLVLAGVAVAALAATTTACGPEEVTDSGSSAAPSAVATDGSEESAGSDKSDDAGGSNDTSDSAGGDKSGYGQVCGANDLEFSVTSETQAGGYYLVTAKAKSGITCTLEENTPVVSFGSDAENVASPVGQGGADPIELSGSAVAYTGISPKTTNSDGGVEFESVILSTTEGDPNPAEIQLPDTATVEKPIVTNWSTDSSETVPVIV
ncbi:DUF4232 domain-containing protein [Streptomyces sp. NPDC006643]|uniref:DUF4232 domain-containing protein n=2 Tax=unclassified Streptomyces TaxID=2593676 RepID=UPI0036A9255F